MDASETIVLNKRKLYTEWVQGYKLLPNFVYGEFKRKECTHHRWR
jgi:hypothetical protein